MAPVRSHAVIVGMALLIIAMVISAAQHYGVPVPTLTRDPLDIANIPPLYGFLSNLGVLIWSMAAAACLVGSRLLYKAGLREEAWFFLASGLLTAMLMLDDLFQIHEIVAPAYFGIPEKAVHSFYMLIAAAYLYRFRRMLRNTETVLFVLAIGSFFMSVALDTVLEHLAFEKHLGVSRMILEDAAKFLGIFCWCGFFVRRVLQTVPVTQAQDATQPSNPTLTRYAAPDSRV